MAEELTGRLSALVGQSAGEVWARHLIGTAAIADLCDAIGDDNPCYTDPEYAATSCHGGLVAPPASLDIWDRPGLPAQRTDIKRAATDPRSLALTMLDDAGYRGVVAVNSDLELARYLRPGERVGHDQILESVTGPKQTALGIGYFLTTRHRYRTDSGEHVGDLTFRLLKFQPGTGTAGPAPETNRRPPDADPALRPRPARNRDNDAVWAGYDRQTVSVTACGDCHRGIAPPGPRCGSCGSLRVTTRPVEGPWTLYTWAAVHQPQVPGFRYPLVVALGEAEDGSRLLADLDGAEPGDVTIGMPLVVGWQRAGESTLPVFRPAPPQRAVETRSRGSVTAGDRLPLWALPVTATQIVSGALASRDFQDVHHDHALALAKGSPDIFLNINTSVALMARYVTDWAGPQALVRALRVRLGAQACPGSTLRFTGTVAEADPTTGLVSVDVSATNAAGPHVTGRVELELTA